ncbi:hypothetical protein FNV43_RR24212 [Rhamnella rubrinervis]|uniref:Uncharacterized protein n=1 Tax=Rhamnella rubrinervis TaxID=2594499 RepID=A0A8K0DSL7_9ROSA|nr:hypothetical protein FNV43_RR24212 [Rhamnella rubrinervis]
MFDSTFDLINQIASNSLFVFCFCNLIIVIILIGSKLGSNIDQQSEIPLSMVTNRSTNDKQSVNARVPHGYEEEVIESKLVSEVSNAQKALGNDNKTGSEAENKAEDDDGDEDDDDELRKRVEEFIEMVNKGWKAEMLKSSP